MPYKLGHDKFSFTEMYDSLNERDYSDLPDDKLIKLHNKMKDQNLSKIAAQQFKMIIKAMKDRKLPLTESSDNKKLHKDAIKIAEDALKKVDKLWGKSDSKAVGMALESLKNKLDEWMKGYKNLSVSESIEEGSTENAKKSLDAIIGHLEKRKSSGADVLGATGRSMLKMGNGIAASYKEEGSFSPDQAKWIWKTSVALFKK